MSIKKIIDCIKTYNSFLITTHHNLEGDALGSEIAFYYLLKKLGKTAVMVNQDCTPEEYAFLNGAERIKIYKPNLSLKYDVLVFLDCSTKSRCGGVSDLAGAAKFIINIDHHISNEKYGDINWVKPNASSVSEMIYELYKNMHIKIDNQVALALYVGILTDTGSFRYINTNFYTHEIVAELLKFNLDASKIYRNIYESVPYSGILLLSRIFLTLRRYASGKIIVFEMRRNLLKGREIDFDLTEHVLNFGRLIREYKVCVLFRELEGKERQIRVNLRSQGEVDVNRIAQFFGGGGHKTAAGCTLLGNLQSVKRRVINKIRQQLLA